MSRATRNRAAVADSERTDAEGQRAAYGNTKVASHDSDQSGAQPRAPLRASWLSPDTMPVGRLVQIKLQSGAIHDGMRDQDGSTWVWNPVGKPRRAAALRGWLPRQDGRKLAVKYARLSLGEVHDRVMSAMRTLRVIRVEQGPLQPRSNWPREWADIADKLNLWVDRIGHYDDETGRYVPLDQLQRGAPDEPPIAEIYTPTTRELSLGVMLPSLGWWAALRPKPDSANYRKLALLGLEQALGQEPSNYVPGSTVWTPGQRAVWLRSFACPAPAGEGQAVRPAQWTWIAGVMRMHPVAVQRLAEDAMRRMWFFANVED